MGRDTTGQPEPGVAAGEPGPATSHTRTPLSRERILQAAVDLADEQGVDALSMRKLARELGFEVMSLYNHVSSKADLLDGMVDLVAGDIELPGSGRDWKAAVRRSTVSAHESLVRHPWVGALWSTRAPGPARLRYTDALLGCLRGAGFSAAATYRGFHALSGHLVGFTLHELRLPMTDDDIREAAAEYLRDFPAEQYPHMAEHVRQHVDGSVGGDSFELVLDLILDGIEALDVVTP